MPQNFTFKLLSLKIPLLCFILFVKVDITAQTSDAISTELNLSRQYERSSLAIVIIDHPENRHFHLVKNNPIRAISAKFDDHNVSTMFISVPSNISSESAERVNAIKTALEQSSIGLEILAKWFCKTDSGFSTSLIQQRGMYTAGKISGDARHIDTRGDAGLKDAGKRLIEKTYVVVLDYTNLETFEEYYIRQAAQSNKTSSKLGKQVAATVLPKDLQEKNQEVNNTKSDLGLNDKNKQYGFRSKVVTYLYKLDWSEEKTNDFYNNIWDYPEKFSDIKLNFIGSTILKGKDASGSEDLKTHLKRPTPDATLITTLQENALENSMFRLIRKNEDFQAKIGLARTNPNYAFVGQKEGLSRHQRFFVYQPYQNSKGRFGYKRVASLRVAQASDNMQIINDSIRPSEFYQDWGIAVDEGIMIQQQPDWGVGITGFYGRMNSAQLGARVDYNLGSLFNSIGDVFGVSSTRRQTLQIRLCGEYSRLSGFDLGVFDKTYISRMALGLSGYINLLRTIKLEPYVNWVSQTLYMQSSDAAWNTWAKNQNQPERELKTYEIGLRIPLSIPVAGNMLSSIKIVPSAGLMFNSFASVYNAPALESKFGANLGIRYNF